MATKKDAMFYETVERSSKRGTYCTLMAVMGYRHMYTITQICVT